MTARRLSLLAAVVAAVVALSVMVLSLIPFGDEKGAGVALIGGPYELVDQTGRVVTEQTDAGKLRLIYFGYTYCPDVCPTELSVMSQALDLLGEDAAEVQPIFITIDPQRDTPAQMAEYVQHFYPSMLGLTGSPEQVAAAAKTYRVYYAKGPGDDEDYLMDHSSFIYVMGRDGSYLAHFGPNTAPETMAEQLRKLL
ncbi:MAG: SCO family protein [Alphaproteobacteria bacterium]